MNTETGEIVHLQFKTQEDYVAYKSLTDGIKSLFTQMHEYDSDYNLFDTHVVPLMYKAIVLHKMAVDLFGKGYATSDIEGAIDDVGHILHGHGYNVCGYDVCPC